MRVETFAQAGLERLHFDHLFIQDIFCILEFIKVTIEVIQSLNNKINRASYLRDKVSEYFKKNYIGKNIKIIVFGNYEVENTERLLKKNLLMIHNNDKYIPPKKLFKNVPIFTNKEIVIELLT